MNKTHILSLISLSLVSPSSFAALNISFDYTGYDAGPGGAASVSDIFKNDGWTGATSDFDKLAAGKAVMEEAASMIENLFVNCTTVTVNQTIAVDWQSHGGSTLATGGTSFFSSGALAGGSLNWDSDGSSTFFVDTSPGDNVEYTRAEGPDQRTINFGGTNINVEDRYYDSFTGSAAGSNSDMLSTAIHEVMHALGVLGGYPGYSSLDIGNDGDLDLVANGNTYEVDYTGGHTDLTLPWDGPGTLGGTYYPNVIGPSTVTGSRGLITDIDALLLANIHGFCTDDYGLINQPFGTVPIPEPSASLLLALSSLVLIKRKRS